MISRQKPFAFRIPGTVGGYRTLWLYVGITKNDPKFMVRYIVHCVEEVAGCPSLVRTDVEQRTQ